MEGYRYHTKVKVPVFRLGVVSLETSVLRSSLSCNHSTGSVDIRPCALSYVLLDADLASNRGLEAVGVLRTTESSCSDSSM